jgi:hypothetical protein
MNDVLTWITNNGVPAFLIGVGVLVAIDIVCDSVRDTVVALRKK